MQPPLINDLDGQPGRNSTLSQKCRWQLSALLVGEGYEVGRVGFQREQVQEQLKQLGGAFVDDLIDESDFERQKA